MTRMFAFGLFLASTSLVMAQAPAEKAKLDLSTTRLKASHAIGINIGKSLKADGLEVDIAALAAGLRASLDGKEAKLSVAQMRQAMTAFQQEMQTKLTARPAALKNKADGAAFLAKNAKNAIVGLVPRSA